MNLSWSDRMADKVVRKMCRISILDPVTDLMGGTGKMMIKISHGDGNLVIYTTPEITVREVYRIGDALRAAGFEEMGGVYFSISIRVDDPDSKSKFESLCELAAELARGGSRSSRRASQLGERQLPTSGLVAMLAH